jgi:hypothetical protein
MALTGSEDHKIRLEDASSQTKAFRAGVPADGVLGGYLGREIIDAILRQPGCIGIRYYFARHVKNYPTVVLVGVTSDNADLWQGVLAEETWPCPPFCPPANPLNS